MKQILTVALTLVVAGTLVVAQNPRDPQVLFKAAQHTEEVQGDLKAAIAQYQLVVAAGNRALAAQALLRMAACYDKLGGTESRAIYERVAREYADQREAVAIAQARLGGAGRTAQKSITLRRVWDGRASESTAAVLTTVSRDGRRLAYQPLGTGTVNVHDLATGADRVLDGPALAGAPAISRDGTQVAYAWYGGAYGSELRIVNVPQHGSPVPRRLYESAEATQITPMDFSPDGTSVVVLLGRRTDRTHQIGLVNAHDGSLRVLKSLAWRFPTRIFFSPDGHDLAYDLPASDSSDQRDVFVLAVDGSREVPVVVHPSHDIVMGWSPASTGKAQDIGHPKNKNLLPSAAG